MRLRNERAANEAAPSKSNDARFTNFYECRRSCEYHHFCECRRFC
jgi:hypothetical protein